MNFCASVSISVFFLSFFLSLSLSLSLSQTFVKLHTNPQWQWHASSISRAHLISPTIIKGEGEGSSSFVCVLSVCLSERLLLPDCTEVAMAERCYGRGREREKKGSPTTHNR